MIVADSLERAKKIDDFIAGYAEHNYLTINYNQGKSNFIHPRNYKANPVGSFKIGKLEETTHYKYLGINVRFGQSGRQSSIEDIKVKKKTLKDSLNMAARFINLPENLNRPHYKNSRLFSSIVRGVLANTLPPNKTWLGDQPYFTRGA